MGWRKEEPKPPSLEDLQIMVKKALINSEQALRVANEANNRTKIAQAIVERLSRDLRLYGYTLPVSRGQQED